MSGSPCGPVSAACEAARLSSAEMTEAGFGHGGAACRLGVPPGHGAFRAVGTCSGVAIVVTLPHRARHACESSCVRADARSVIVRELSRSAGMIEMGR
jgi:hypothetical protein